MKAYILLEDGTTIEGTSFGAQKTVMGEIVFNTGMTGYQEVLTDPSYAGQVVVMTYPLIGNYGVNLDDVQSESIKVNGFVVKEYCEMESNWKSTGNLSDYLKDNDIFAIADVDTRMLTKKIRKQGTMNCIVTTEEITDELMDKLDKYKFPVDVVANVSRKQKEIIPAPGKKVGILDFGVKSYIIKYLKQLGCEIHIYPWNTSAKAILNDKLDAILFSNGPGDPKDVQEAVATAGNLIGKLPIFCICLGHQIVSLALGADTYKLKFGHRGSNHPVIDKRNNRVTMTSQNHGYAVSDKGLPDNIQVTHVNVNDNTIEGYSCPDLNIHSVQFHPEAGPGPEDASYLFKEWVESIGGGK